MKKRNLIIIGAVLVLTLLGIHLYNNFFTKNMLIGTYVNQNYNYTPFLPDIPYFPDTLNIFKDGRFVSSHWGEGQYKLSYSIKGTTIDLTYNYEFGKGSYRTSITRKLFGTPKIMLYRKKNHCYVKLD